MAMSCHTPWRFKTFFEIHIIYEYAQLYPHFEIHRFGFDIYKEANEPVTSSIDSKQQLYEYTSLKKIKKFLKKNVWIPSISWNDYL